jgi:hypothetical protein
MKIIDEMICKAAKEGEIVLRDNALLLYRNRLEVFGTIEDHKFTLNEYGWKRYNELNTKREMNRTEDANTYNINITTNNKGLFNITTQEKKQIK